MKRKDQQPEKAELRVSINQLPIQFYPKHPNDKSPSPLQDIQSFEYYPLNQQVWSHNIQKLSHQLKSPQAEEPKLKSKEARERKGDAVGEIFPVHHIVDLGTHVHAQWVSDLEPTTGVPWSPGDTGCPARHSGSFPMHTHGLTKF